MMSCSLLRGLVPEIHRTLMRLRRAPFNTGTTATKVDPFGLRDSDEAELSATVQGLYSTDIRTNREVKEVPAAALPLERSEVYKSWLEEAVVSRRNAKLLAARGSELAREASFGAIRFDEDNVPIAGREDEEQGDYFFDNRLTIDPVEVPIVDQNGNQNPPGVTTSSGLSAGGLTKYDVPLSPRIAGILKKNDPIETSGGPDIPSAYKLQSLNNLTRAEVWNLLRDNVIFQNEFIVAINKPYGLPIHSPSNECRHTMLDFLEELGTYCKATKQVYPLHRLDKDTTGVLLFAKTQMAAIIIKEKFAKQQIHKKYLTITKNCPQMPRGTIDIPISEGRVASSDLYRSVLKPDLRSFKIASKQTGAKRAVTHFKVINLSDTCSFMEVRPETGVKHQIRIHLGMGLGCPVLGDHKYSHREKLAPQRLSPSVLIPLNIKQSKVRYLPLHLHCSSVEFTMPEGLVKSQEPVFIHCRPPNPFMHTLRALKLK